MLSTPLICSSSGAATVFATVSGLAPGNNAVTTTDGGTTSGYSEIGSCGIAIKPARKMAIEMTPAKIGRSMKNFDNDMAVLPAVARRRSIARGAAVGLLTHVDLWAHGDARRETLKMIEDDAVARF